MKSYYVWYTDIKQMAQGLLRSIHQLIKKYPLQLLFLTWLLMQVTLMLVVGIVTDKEAIKYSDEAQYLLAHHSFSQPKYLFYSLYVSLHVLFYAMGAETTGVYLFQLIFNGCALLLLYKTALQLSKSKAVAFITALLLVICHLWQYWTVFLYTESVFCNLVIVLVYMLFGPVRPGVQKNVLIAVVFMALLLARPTGLLFIPVLGFLPVARLWNERRYYLAILAMVCISLGFLGLLSYAMQGGSSFDFIKPLIEHNVLCYIPDDATTGHVEFYHGPQGITGIMDYIITHPLDFLILGGKKLLSFWGVVRPHFSAMHNAVLMAYFYPIYLLALAGCWFARNRCRQLLLFTTGSWLVFSFSVVVTCDDWTSRFIMPIVPLIILMAGIGFHGLWKRFNKALR